MLSESTARLVENAVVLGDPELVQIKGADEPVLARRLLAIGAHRPSRRTESALIGRTWELNTITAILDEAIGGAGCVVTVAGPPGIGKSRLMREAAAVAAGRGVEVLSTYCESHAHDVPFHVLARLLRSGMGSTIWTSRLPGYRSMTNAAMRRPKTSSFSRTYWEFATPRNRYPTSLPTRDAGD